MDAIETRWLREETGTAEILIEGLPGIGHVGKLVAEHMIQEFHAVKIAELFSITRIAAIADFSMAFSACL